MKGFRSIEMSLGQVIEEFVDDDLMEKVSTFLQDQKVSVGTVHHSLGMIVAEDICHQAENTEQALACLTTFHHYMYQLVSQTMMAKAKKREH